MLSLSILNYVQCWMNTFYVCVHAQSLSHVWLWNHMDYILPVSSVHGILQARMLEWVAISSSRGFSWSRDWTQVSCLLPCKAESLPLYPIGNHLLYISSSVTQSCLTLHDHITAAHQASLLYMNGYKYIASGQLHSKLISLQFRSH